MTSFAKKSNWPETRWSQKVANQCTVAHRRIIPRPATTVAFCIVGNAFVQAIRLWIKSKQLEMFVFARQTALPLFKRQCLGRRVCLQHHQIQGNGGLSPSCNSNSIDQGSGQAMWRMQGDFELGQRFVLFPFVAFFQVKRSVRVDEEWVNPSCTFVSHFAHRIHGKAVRKENRLEISRVIRWPEHFVKRQWVLRQTESHVAKRLYKVLARHHHITIVCRPTQRQQTVSFVSGFENIIPVQISLKN